MEIKNTIMIDDKIVDKVFSKGKLTIYKTREEEEVDSVYFFCENETVLFRQEINVTYGAHGECFRGTSFWGVK